MYAAEYKTSTLHYARRINTPLRFCHSIALGSITRPLFGKYACISPSGGSNDRSRENGRNANDHFWGGNESWRLSSLPLPRGGEGSLHHPFLPHPLPISDWKASYRIVVTMENAGEGGGEEPLECDPLFFANGYSVLSLFLTILCFVNRNCERGERSNRWAKKGKTQVRLLVFHCFFFPWKLSWLI